MPSTAVGRALQRSYTNADNSDVAPRRRRASFTEARPKSPVETVALTEATLARARAARAAQAAYAPPEIAPRLEDADDSGRSSPYGMET